MNQSPFDDLKPLLLTPTVRLERSGKCIYCGSFRYSKDRLQLGDEHVIAFSLGGKLLLPEASCQHCETITNRIERFVGRTLLGNMRIKHNLPTRRRKDRPETITTKILRDGIHAFTELKAEEASLAVGLLEFDRPGVISGIWPTAELQKPKVRVIFATPKQNSLWHQGVEETEFKVEHTIFCRMLAKIAHAYTLSKLKQDEFYPILLPTIFGLSDRSHYYIGCDQKQPVENHNVLHDIHLRFRRHRGIEYGVVVLQLFAPLGLPVYEIYSAIIHR